jgi:hypothetical protein
LNPTLACGRARALSHWFCNSYQINSKLPLAPLYFSCFSQRNEYWNVPIHQLFTETILHRILMNVAQASKEIGFVGDCTALEIEIENEQ